MWAKIPARGRELAPAAAGVVGVIATGNALRDRNLRSGKASASSLKGPCCSRQPGVARAPFQLRSRHQPPTFRSRLCARARPRFAWRVLRSTCSAWRPA